MKAYLYRAFLVTTSAVCAVASSEVGLTYQLYKNAALAGSPARSGTSSSATLSPQDDCFLSGELVGTIQFNHAGIWRFDCHFNHTSTGFVWIDGHLVCGDGNPVNPQIETDNPLPIKDPGRVYPFRAHITTNDTTCEHPFSLEVDFSVEKAATAESLIETQRLRSLRHSPELWQEAKNGDVNFKPHLPPAEAKREKLQRSLTTGWGSWVRVNLLSIVKLPEGLAIELLFCRRSTGECLKKAVPDDNTARVDLHAYDRSYVGFNVTFQQATASIEYAVTEGDQLQALVSIWDCPSQDCSDFDIYFTARYAWFRPGNFSLLPSPDFGFTCNSPGFDTINVTVLKSDRDGERMDGVIDNSYLDGGIGINSPALRFSLGKQGTKLGILAGIQGPSIQDIEAHLRANKAAELERLRAKFGPDKAAVAEAIQCAVMWTLIYNPVENGPFMPVSRSEAWSFTKKSNAATSDWTYTIFDWDNLFASLLAGLDNKDIAYSNLFQVVKSITGEGFIPNWSTCGTKSQDRTEPPVGAKVVLELYHKYKETWPVEIVFDDLLSWNDWFMENRVLQPAGLIALGSYYKPDSNSPQPDTGETWNTMQAARFESGLDNSPMYDGNFFDKDSTHMMQLYDAGMSSLVSQEAYSLAELADVIGRDPKVGQMLRARAGVLAAKIATQLWDPQQGIFANRFPNGTFSHHISPTSFYPLGVGAASQEQTDSMLQSWMLNSTRFCISPEGDFEGNDPDVCYWGLPSISADDPTYLKGHFIYWRGYSWGPMAQLVYWSLEDSGSDEEGKTRKALCKQMEALMVSQWTENRHICENYHPHQNASECSGTRFYHWGALNGFIGMMEAGFWSYDVVEGNNTQEKHATHD